MQSENNSHTHQQCRIRQHANPLAAPYPSTVSVVIYLVEMLSQFHWINKLIIEEKSIPLNKILQMRSMPLFMYGHIKNEEGDQNQDLY